MALRAPCPILLLLQSKFSPLCHWSCLFTLSLSLTPLVKAETTAGDVPLPGASLLKTPGKVSFAFFSLLISLQKFSPLILLPSPLGSQFIHRDGDMVQVESVATSMLNFFSALSWECDCTYFPWDTNGANPFLPWS